jgi:hypothetical protein
LLRRIIEYFLGQETEDDHVVLADGETLAAGRDDFVDESGPVVRPFLLQDGYKDEVELVQEGSLRSECLFRARALEDVLNDEVPDSYAMLDSQDAGNQASIHTLTLLPRQDLPPRQDNIVEDLQAQNCNLSAALLSVSRR